MVIILIIFVVVVMLDSVYFLPVILRKYDRYGTTVLMLFTNGKCVLGYLL